MSLQWQLLIWAAVLAALLLALSLLGSAITPFATGIALGYLLDPVVRRLERLGLSRLAASVLILGVFIVTLALILVIVAPILGGQLIDFAAKLPGYVMRLQALVVEEGSMLIEKYGGPWRKSFGLGESLTVDQIQKSIGDFVAQGAQVLLNVVRSLASGGFAILNFFSLLVVTPVVAFYILVDWEKMIAAINSWLPLDHRDTLRALAAETNAAVAGFLRGQSLVALFLGVWYGLGLSVIGLDFGFLIGVIGGVLSFVPYVGSLTALVLSLGVGLVQGWPKLNLFFLALGIVGVGQFLERLRHFADVGRKVDRPAPGLVDVRIVRIRRTVRLYRAAGRGADSGGARRRRPPSPAALSHEPALSRPRRGGGPAVTAPARQLTLDWPHETSWAREDFLIAPENAGALRTLEAWPRWPSPVQLLVGPRGSGKSHLGAIWARLAQAGAVSAERLADGASGGARGRASLADRGRGPYRARGSGAVPPAQSAQ